MAYGTEQIGAEAARVLKRCPNVAAALLMGSCARGEETYFTNLNGEMELLSDYELLIVTKDKSDRSGCEKALRALAGTLKEQSSSGRFELKWSYKSESELKRLDRRFIFFEARECAKIIYGDPAVLEHFPPITVRNLNYCELDTVIIHRLYHVLRDMWISDEKYRKYLIARNTLDIPSVVLPWEGILAGTYQKRIRLFLDLPDTAFISNDLKKRLADYFEMKKNYDSELYEQYALEHMKECFVSDFRALYMYQRDKQRGKAFRRGGRLLISAAYRRDLNLFKLWLGWPGLNEKLCSDMFDAMGSRVIYEQKIEEIRDAMMKLYGYH